MGYIDKFFEGQSAESGTKQLSLFYYGYEGFKAILSASGDLHTHGEGESIEDALINLNMGELIGGKPSVVGSRMLSSRFKTGLIGKCIRMVKNEDGYKVMYIKPKIKKHAQDTAYNIEYTVQTGANVSAENALCNGISYFASAIKSADAYRLKNMTKALPDFHGLKAGK